MKEYVKCFKCGIEVEEGFEWVSYQDNHSYCSECGNELQRLIMINNTWIMNAKETKIFNSIARAWKKRIEGEFTFKDFDILYNAFMDKLTEEEQKRIKYNLNRCGM